MTSRADSIAHDAVLHVSLLPTEQGGRMGPILGGNNQFRPMLEWEGAYWVCCFLLPASGPLAPGSQATVPVAFLSPERLLPLLRVGGSCWIWEGRVVAHATIVSLRSLDSPP